ncbi:MAG: ABC transporter permease [Leucobacter sp.]
MKWLGLTPFALYVLAFLALPAVLAVGTGFFDNDGGFTLQNFAVLAEPNIMSSFWASIWVSALTATIGAIVGALLCYAMLGATSSGFLSRAINAASSVLAQFGGVMLAFAFIATIGIQGIITVILRDRLGVDLFENGVWLYQLPGLILPYLYFQIPLMVIVFFPAVQGLRREWAEATATLGGGSFTYWAKIAGPILAPSFLGSLLLLFANSFSSYATAAALISQGAQIVPLQIRSALIAETGASRANAAGALALGMLVVMLVVMLGYSALQRRASRWQH